jgi:predicted transcriptional regulator
MSESERPTATEMAILRILWDRGPSTVRQVHEALKTDRSIGYTGALKFLQIMAAKGLAIADKGERTHVYRAAQPPGATKRRAVGDLMRKVFAGSASQLVLHALEEKTPSQEDIAEIRRMLDACERKMEDR